MSNLYMFSRLRRFLAEQSAQMPAFTPPVHSMHERLRSAFSSDRATKQTANDDCVAVINRFLTLIDWTQSQRRLFEAMPHADTLDSVAALRTVLFNLGFKTTIEKAAFGNLRKEYLPCFIKNSEGRVFLAEKAGDDGSIILFDPVQGECVPVTADAIEGTAIFPEAIENRDAKTGIAAPTWSATALSAFRPIIRQVFIISFVVNLLALAPPIFVMSVYDKALGAKSVDVLIGLTIGIVLVVAADFALRQLRVRLQAYLGSRIDEQLNETAFRHLLHLSLSHTEDAPIGSQLTRMRQMTSLHEAFTGPLASAFFDLPFVLLYIAVIAMIGGHLVWVPISLIAVYVVVAAWALPRNSRLIRNAGDARAQLNNLTVEAVSAQRAIRDLAAEHVWLRRQRKLSAESAVATMKSRQLNFLLQTFSQSVVAIAGVATLTIGTLQVISGDLSGGALIAVMALAWRVLGPIRNLFLCGLTLGQTLQGIQQIDRLVRMPLERTPNSGPSIPRSFKGHIVFDNITFRYPSQREPSLRGVSFSVKPGQLLCLYGQSGSGTSTVLRVLLGLYQQQAGSIFIDGLNLQQLDKGEWRHALGVGLQSPDLFHGTIVQNIRLARPDATDQEIDQIVKKLGIDRFFGGALEQGLETRCTTMAKSTWPDALLSRITLARAFVGEAPVYLLDEPAGTLDTAGEAALASILMEKKRTSSIIMTTQNPNQMRIADIVVWMNRGAVYAMGPPDKVVPKILAA